MAEQTPRQIAGNAIARCLQPEAWAELDAGKGVCSAHAGWDIKDSIKQAAALMNKWPAIVDVIARI
jgi:hypothetical protein